MSEHHPRSPFSGWAFAAEITGLPSSFNPVLVAVASGPPAMSKRTVSPDQTATDHDGNDE